MLDSYEAVERAETDLDNFIARRIREREKLNAEAALSKGSERAYQLKKREAIRAEWYSHYLRMANAHREISEGYAAKAEALCERTAS